jgi:ribosomal protein S24E
MESTRVQATEQPLLKRTHAAYRISYEGATPSRTSVVQHLSSKEKGTVVVTHLYTQQGQQVAHVECYIYKDAAVAKAVTRENLLAKQQPKAAEESA